MHNTSNNMTTGVRCRSRTKCEGCIFVIRDGDKNGKENENSPSRQKNRHDHKDL